MPSPTNTIEQRIDVKTIPRLVAFPKDIDYFDPDEGIVLDVYDIIKPLFEGASDDFWHTLTTSFWEMGLIKKPDFLLPSAHKKIKRALNLAIRKDVLSILAKLQETSI